MPPILHIELFSAEAVARPYPRYEETYNTGPW